MTITRRLQLLMVLLLPVLLASPLWALDSAERSPEVFAPLPVPGALSVSDLASDTDWTLRLDDGLARPIKVPGGGWNSDLQSPPIQVMREVKDFVRYERTITVPASAQGQAVQLRFGAVAHGCEVFLDGKKVGEHHGPQVPFTIDLTSCAVPGEAQVLQVKVYHRRHYLAKNSKKTAEVAVGWDYPDGDDEASRAEGRDWCDWYGQSKVAYGIARSVALVVLPAVHVEEVFVRPSVAKQQFACDVWVRNETAQPRTLTLGGTFSSWNKRGWKYPGVPSVPVTIPAKSTVKVALPTVDWKLGVESYWWPNIPFREDYLAQLHFLNLQLKEGNQVLQTYPQRFGFVEHAEGPHYYTVNGVRVTGISDATAEGQVSFYDAYSSPAWLPPSGPGTGAPESWRRYMRIGINANRLHASPPTEYMMQTADELGFLLIPEAPIWGNGLSRYCPAYTPQTYHDMGRACRNHPSVARYSLTNEVRDKRDERWPWRAAIDDMREVDDLHPLTFELHALGNGKVEGFKGGHAWIMEHYTDIHEKVGPEKGIRGMGEHFWHTDMGSYAVGIRTLRVNDWCYMSGWSWINYWPNFLQGMNHDLHAWKHNNHADRADGVDGWGSPIVEFTQRSLHPYLVQDVGILAANPGGPRSLTNGKIEWPYQFPMAIVGTSVERSVMIFNGGLSGSRFAFAWSAHWDRPEGPVAIPGTENSFEIEPGGHMLQKIAFDVPDPGQADRRLCLVMDSRKDGVPVFREDKVYLNVTTRKFHSAATFLGTDDTTRGDWQGKYGAEGYELVAKESKLPANLNLAWQSGKLWTYAAATDDSRALAYFANPPTGKDRIAAGRYGVEVAFTVDVGESQRRLTIYHLDYDRKSRKQSVEIADALSGQVFDKREIANFSEGRYQSWQVQGRLRVTFHRASGDNATVAGIFFDPPEKGDKPAIP